MGERTQAFLAALSDDGRAALGNVPDLEARLDDGIRTARERWPDLVVGELELLRFVADRASTLSALGELRWGDLGLACAVAAGDATAGAHLRALCLPKIRAALASIGLGASIDETAQDVLTGLVLPDARGRRGIEAYRGTGDLAAFVKVIAVRSARHAHQRRRREEPLDPSAVIERDGAAVDPELAALKQKYRLEFKQAFHAALETLTERERNILKYELVGGLGIDQIGALYDVHRATVARWRAACREKLLRGTEAALRERLAIEVGDFQSIIRLIRSELDVSLHRVLNEEAEGA
jgi:RNA polymerase sigma-70 factor (ECF subfamily)